MAEALPDAKLVLIEEQNHISLILDRAAVLEPTQAWLESHFNREAATAVAAGLGSL